MLLSTAARIAHPFNLSRVGLALSSHFGTHATVGAMPVRGLCRLMLRTPDNGLPPPSAADQETFEEHMKEMSSKRLTPPTETQEITSEAALLELKKAARRAAEENRGFQDGMLPHVTSETLGHAEADRL